jgi:hypothetical protein
MHLDPWMQQTHARPGSTLREDPSMRTIRRLVERSDGKAEFLPLGERWQAAGVLADTFPLDRELARAPRRARQAANWVRLALVDRPITNPERTAFFTLGETPWMPALGAAVAAALVAPRLPRWARWAGLAGLGIWAIRGGRVARFVAMRRELGRVAPGALIVADFVAREPGAGMDWVSTALRTVDDGTPFVALLPASGNDRRDAARERLYTRRLGARTVGRVDAGGQQVAILVLD